jgi:signal transduction histidine kinase
LDGVIPRWRTVIGYGIVASAWIISTDFVADAYAHTSFLQVEVVKGWFFVLASAVFLKLLIDTHTRKIRTSEQRLHSIIDSMADGIVIVDHEANTIRANPAAATLFGVSDAAQLLKPFKDLARDFDVRTPNGTLLAGDGDAISRATRGETTPHMEITLQRRDGRRVTIAASVAPVHDRPAGEIVLAIAVLRDVSELKRLELLRDEFLSTAAHELKNPITTLKTYVQMLRRFPEHALAGETDVLTLLDKQCTRLAGLVQELLDVSRLQLGSLALRPKTFDLTDLVEQLARSFRSVVPTHRFVVEAERGSVVSADVERIQQVLINLVDNATKFSPAGTDITVSVRRKADEIETSVADSGIGIEADKQRLLFQRFTQLHAGTEHDKGGLGLGLYISREIVARHHGRIWVESTVGRGSVFHFSLPPAPREAHAESI